MSTAMHEGTAPPALTVAATPATQPPPKALQPSPRKKGSDTRKPSEQDLTGVLGGRYRVGEKIGRGAFGVVYKALDSESGEFVAVKRISTANMRPRQVERLKAEALLMKRLHHENIVGFKDVIEHDGYVHFILEYVDSGTLASLVVKYGPLSERLLAMYARQILSALSFLHQHGIVHRVNNLLITNTGTIKLADFGIAHLVETPNEALKTLRANKNLASNAMDDVDGDVGSPYWMSPEVIKMVEATPASDIWSFGCTCLELLTGKPPYWEYSKTQACFRMVEEDHPPLPPNLSALLYDMLLQCLVQEPRDRSTAADLLQHEWFKTVDPRKPSAEVVAAAATAAAAAVVPAAVVTAPVAPPPPPAVPAHDDSTIRKKHCGRCVGKLSSFSAKECGKCKLLMCKKCLQPKKVATLRGGKPGKAVWCCVDCFHAAGDKKMIELE